MVLFAESDGIVLTSVVTFTILAGAGTVIAYMFRMLIITKDEVIQAKEKAHELALLQLAAEKKEEESRKRSYEEIAREAIKSATETANYYRLRDGKPPIIPEAPVVSESHSPSTAIQRETASIATLRATMAKIKLVTGQEPREEPPQAIEPVLLDPTIVNVQPEVTMSEAIGLKRAIQQIPEVTADRVIEKLKNEN